MIAKRSGFLSFLLMLSLLVIPEVARAEAPPSERIRGVIDDVQRVVKGNNGKLDDEALDTKLKEIILPMFNFEEMSRRSLGAYWNKGTPEERAEFVKLFSDLLASTYLKRIKRNAEDSKITHISDKIDGDKATVRSTVLASGENVQIDYRLLKEAAGWRIYDVMIENVGLVSNYRNEFPGVIREEGFAGLNKRLKEKKVAPAAEKK